MFTEYRLTAHEMRTLLDKVPDLCPSSHASQQPPTRNMTSPASERLKKNMRLLLEEESLRQGACAQLMEDASMQVLPVNAMTCHSSGTGSATVMKARLPEKI